MYTIIVLLDYKNLISFITIKKLNQRQIRWAELLVNFDFQIRYYKGTKNVAADALSQRKDY
jgi:hypothetical protein